MTDELIPAEGISRRDMLKRSAVVGGASAMVWAAPSITTLGARAFGTEGTGLQGFSYAAAVVRCGGTDGITYRVKYERDLLGFEEEPNELPACELSGFATGPWATARKVSPDAEGTNPGVWTKSPGGNPLNTGDQLLEHSFSIKVSQSGLLLHFDLTSSDGCTFINSGLEGGVAKEGQNLCSTAVTLSNNDMRLTFDLGEYEVLGSPLVTG